MSTTTMTYPDVAMGVQATLAAYTQALDAGRFDEVVATFTADGVFEIPDFGVLAQGGDAIRGYYAAATSELSMRHVLVNTLVTGWKDDEAETSSDLLVVQKGEAGWTVLMVGRYRDKLHHVGGSWLFQRRTLTFAN